MRGVASKVVREAPSRPPRCTGEDHEDSYIPSPEALVSIADERFSFLSLGKRGGRSTKSPFPAGGSGSSYCCIGGSSARDEAKFSC